MFRSEVVEILDKSWHGSPVLVRDSNRQSSNRTVFMQIPSSIDRWLDELTYSKYVHAQSDPGWHCNLKQVNSDGVHGNAVNSGVTQGGLGLRKRTLPAANISGHYELANQSGEHNAARTYVCTALIPRIFELIVSPGQAYTFHHAHPSTCKHTSKVKYANALRRRGLPKVAAWCKLHVVRIHPSTFNLIPARP